ncbi:hypothetical protein LINPERHAP1_LOCUS40568 [Linum perenne]
MTLLANNIALNHKVFIPMNEKNEEWYLLVISLKERTVYICDCCSAPNIHETHRESALHMEESAYKDDVTQKGREDI